MERANDLKDHAHGPVAVEAPVKPEPIARGFS